MVEVQCSPPSMPALTHELTVCVCVQLASEDYTTYTITMNSCPWSRLLTGLYSSIVSFLSLLLPDCFLGIRSL